jgi:hypothetical protein
VRSSVLHNDEIEPLLRAVQLSILVGMITKADEEYPQILTRQFVMRITSGGSGINDSGVLMRIRSRVPPPQLPDVNASQRCAARQLRFAKKAASSRANSARRKLSRRYALATLSAAPLLISGARRKAMRHAKDGFGFAGWWRVRGLRVRLVTSPMSVERAAMAKPNDPKIGTIRAAHDLSVVRESHYPMCPYSKILAHARFV